MWHASIAHHGRRPIEPGTEHIERALRALRGVGDRDLGQWVEIGVRAMHVRRRLSMAEVAASGLEMRDIRGTREADDRLDVVRAFGVLPPGYTEP